MNKNLPRWADLFLIPLLNLSLALFVSGLVVLFIGENPFEAVKILVSGALGSKEAIGFTLYYATNFIFTGLAVAVAFHAGLFNIGGEGQAMLGGIGVAVVALWLGETHWAVVFVAVTVFAALFGAAWAAIPGYLQARRGSHVVITTIMFNFIASSLSVYLLVNVMKVPGSMVPETRAFAPTGHLPYVSEMFAAVGVKISKTPLNISFLLALAASVGVWVLIWKTKLGYAMRTVGFSQGAAVYGGISPSRIIIIAMALSGALAGLMAVNEIAGAQHRLLLGFSAGYGFVGIAVALMGRGHPFGIFFAAVLFGMLYQGGGELAFDIPTITRDMIVVIQGLVILFTGAMEYMFVPLLLKIFKTPNPQAVGGA
jgi:simple sugar transport system permease protein